MAATSSPVPNPRMIQHLFQTYYSDDSLPKDGQYVSSHWRQEYQYLDVAEGDGELIPASQSYWGCNWSGLRSRVIDQLCVFSHLASMPHKAGILRNRSKAARLCAHMGLDATFTVFRQVCSVELLERHLPDTLKTSPMRALMIGDGIGVLSSLFKAVFPQAKLVLVDIGKTLSYQSYYVQKAHPQSIHKLAGFDTDLQGADFIYCPTENLEELEQFNFSIAVNNNSMQEMNQHTIERYFAFLRKHLEPANLFYCCNRENKVMPGGETSEILNYPWQEQDRLLVDEQCPWQRYYFGRDSAKEGPRLLGLRMPFVNYYDGRIRHRLAVMATT